METTRPRRSGNHVDARKGGSCGYLRRVSVRVRARVRVSAARQAGHRLQLAPFLCFIARAPAVEAEPAEQRVARREERQAGCVDREGR